MRLRHYEIEVNEGTLKIYESPRKMRLFAILGISIASLILYLSITSHNVINTIIFMLILAGCLWDLIRQPLSLEFDRSKNLFSCKGTPVCQLNEVGVLINHDPISKSVAIFDKKRCYLEVSTNAKAQVDNIVAQLQKLAPNNPYLRVHEARSSPISK